MQLTSWKLLSQLSDANKDDTDADNDHKADADNANNADMEQRLHGWDIDSGLAWKVKWTKLI